jgi:TolB protein
MFHKLKLSVLFLIAFCFLAGSTTSHGKVYIDIDSPTIQKFPIAVADFKNLGQTPDRENLGAWFADNLGKTLQLTGFFNIIQRNAFLEDPGQSGITTDIIRFSDWVGIGAESLVKGGFQVEGKDLIAEFRLFDVIQGKLLTGKRYTGKIGDRKEMVLKFAGEILLQLTGEPGVYNTRIAFAVKKGNISEIYTINFDGSDLTRITDFRSLTLLPRWSPGGLEMTFTSYRDGNPDIYLLNLARRSARKISNFAGLNLAASWSPDGTKILMTISKDGDQEIYAMDLREGKTRRLTNDHSINVSPVWSPDGKKIAFVSDRSGSPQIYLMDADGSNPKRLTYQGSYNTSPAWSPRGKRIAYEGMANGSFQIFTMDVDGENVAQLTGSGRNESPSWSPDARYIAFTSRVGGRWRLCVMNANGYNVRVLHEGMAECMNTSWSPRLNLY